MIDLKEFRNRPEIFDTNLDYVGDFRGFWSWKLKIETGGSHILDDIQRGNVS